MEGAFECQIKNAMVEQFNHFIFMFNAAINIFQAAQPVHIQSRQAAFFKVPRSPPRTLHPHHFCFFTGQRIFCHGFAGSVATAIIGKPQIGTQQVGTVDQQGYFIACQFGGFGIIPQITYMLEIVLY